MRRCGGSRGSRPRNAAADLGGFRPADWPLPQRPARPAAVVSALRLVGIPVCRGPQNRHLAGLSRRVDGGVVARLPGRRVGWPGRCRADDRSQRWACRGQSGPGHPAPPAWAGAQRPGGRGVRGPAWPGAGGVVHGNRDAGGPGVRPASGRMGPPRRHRPGTFPRPPICPSFSPIRTPMSGAIRRLRPRSTAWSSAPPPIRPCRRSSGWWTASRSRRLPPDLPLLWVMTPGHHKFQVRLPLEAGASRPVAVVVE